MSNGKKRSVTTTYALEEEEEEEASSSTSALPWTGLEEIETVFDESPTRLAYATGLGSILVTLHARSAPLSGAHVRDPRDLGIITSRFNTLRHPLREVVNEASAASGPMRPPLPPSARTFATEAFVVGGGTKETEAWLADQGATPIERRDDRTLFLAPPERDPVVTAFQLAWKAGRRGALYAHPNFIRQIARPSRVRNGLARLWNHAAIGAPATWSLTNGRGIPEIRVAILDEGVDIAHPALKSAIIANRDFIGGEPTAMPSGDDAHGTACAGIIGSRSRTTPGLAPLVSLVAARIARDDGTGHWVSDDFATADAIEWCWKTTKADVLSCSWGGGLPSDVIAEALAQAQTRAALATAPSLSLRRATMKVRSAFPAPSRGRLSSAR